MLLKLQYDRTSAEAGTREQPTQMSKAAYRMTDEMKRFTRIREDESRAIDRYECAECIFSRCESVVSGILGAVSLVSS